MPWRGRNGALPPSNTYHARPTPTAGSIRVVGRQRSGACLGSFHRCSTLYPIYTSRRLRPPSRVTTACSSARTACLTPAELASIVKRFTVTAPAPLPFHGQHRPPPPHGCALLCYPKCCYTVPDCIFCYAVHPVGRVGGRPVHPQPLIGSPPHVFLPLFGCAAPRGGTRDPHFSGRYGLTLSV